jgi:hypothetical protein
MKRLAFLAPAVAAAVAASTASAQVIAYHHRSTVAGDTFAGAAELVRANGAFLKDEAEAAETWTRVVAARDDIRYRRAEYRYQTRQMDLDYRKRLLEQRQQKLENESAAREVAARRLLDRAQHGLPIWPAAFQRPEYAASTSMVESVLRSWSPENGDPVYRRALATEIGVLRNRVAHNGAIPFAQRVDAVETIKQLQTLVEIIPPAETDQPNGDARLAMK